RFLQAVFPEAVFVLVVRHPVAVVEATSKWRRTATRTSLVHHWAAAHRLMLADLPYLRRVQLVRYEEFVADPDRRLAQIFALVGLDPVPAGEPVRTGINERYFAGWEARARWPHGRLDRAVAVRRHEADARRLGYSLRDPRATIRDVEA
ncbi:MAG TPA: sulfotransferase, partial [Thermoleophilia bacterium]|nr:sulfotransferase [Thermoleophilia bacterium]